MWTSKNAEHVAINYNWSLVSYAVSLITNSSLRIYFYECWHCFTISVCSHHSL